MCFVVYMLQYFSLSMFQFSFMSFVYTFCTLFCSRTIHCAVVFNRELKSTLTPCSDNVLKIIDTMPLSSEGIISQFGGKASNDLNNILDIDEIPDPDGEIADLSKTEYIDSVELSKYLYEHRNEFGIMSLNTQSIGAKFDRPNESLSELYDKELAFSVICL